MSLHPRIEDVTARIVKRSAQARETYLGRMRQAAEEGPRRGHLSCGNQAHAYAAMAGDKDTLVAEQAPNLGIVTSYNDMLSAHQPFEAYPNKIKATARAAGGTAQVAGGVPAMCDGVTQGQVGMELSLFSRDVIALSAGVALSHNTTNQMLMEFMGLHLPGASFVNPGSEMRDALTDAATKRALQITNLGNDYRPVCDILDERTFVNGLVGLMATGGSTNLIIHIIAMARAAGVLLELEDLSDISDATPLVSKTTTPSRS